MVSSHARRHAPSTRRRTGSRPRLASLLACVVVLGACSSGSDQVPGPAEPTAGVLRTEQLEQVVLGPDDVGDALSISFDNDQLRELGEQADSRDVGSVLGGLGCLAELGVLTDPAPMHEARSMHLGEFGFPQATSAASSFASDRDAAASMARLREGLAGCTSVVIDTDEVPMTLSVAHDTETTIAGVDAQLNVTVAGTIGEQDESEQYNQWVSVAQVDDAILAVSYLDIGAGEPQTAEALLGITVERLADLRAGGSATPGQPGASPG